MIVCFKKIKIKVLIISFIFSVLLLIFQTGILEKKLNINAKLDNNEKKSIENQYNDEKTATQNILSYNELQNLEWKIMIPKINLEAKIVEGTTDEILNEFVGHFEETSKNVGNIGLAAHNRGYKVNYFSDLKFLEIGDEILYVYNNTEYKYVIESKNIIKDTDWNWLENTKDNRITLITCVENEPKQRLCVQGVRK
ncbi:MAG: class D sortase [Mycoplasmataceae bacterium]|nr:class D sortase [Mycoplasmataceae bacterium]